MIDVPANFENPPAEIQIAQNLISAGSEYLYHIDDPTAFSLIRPKPKEDRSYMQLKCTEDNKKTIYTIISNMAEHGKLWLLAHKSEMYRMGDTISDVHPLKFLEVIFANSYLKECMIKIFDDYFKRNGFLDDLAPSLTAKAQTGDLNKYRSSFAKAIDVPESEIKPFFDNMEWEEMVRFLMHWPYDDE